jgi:hypothetical protein
LKKSLVRRKYILLNSLSSLVPAFAGLIYRAPRHSLRLTLTKEAYMKKYLVLYRSSVSAQEQMAKATPEQAKAGMDAWMAWAGRAGSAIVDMGSPLGQTANIGGSPPAGHIGGFSILQGESIAAVQKALDGHPHLHMTGNSIEVLEFLPLPGM